MVEISVLPSAAGSITRREMDRRICAAIDSAREEDRRHTVALFDLDQFGRVNRAFGYDVGDRYLHEIAAAMRAVLPDSAVLARCGSDEFMLLLLDTPLIEGWRIAESMVQAVARNPCGHENATLLVTLSGCAAEVSRTTESLAEFHWKLETGCAYAKAERGYVHVGAELA